MSEFAPRTKDQYSVSQESFPERIDDVDKAYLEASASNDERTAAAQSRRIADEYERSHQAEIEAAEKQVALALARRDEIHDGRPLSTDERDIAFAAEQTGALNTSDRVRATRNVWAAERSAADVRRPLVEARTAANHHDRTADSVERQMGALYDNGARL